MNSIEEQLTSLPIVISQAQQGAQQAAMEAQQAAMEAQQAALEAQQAALEAQQAAIETNNNLIWGAIGIALTQETFQNKLEQLISDINDGNFINYSQQDYINIASIVLNNINSPNLIEDINNIIKLLFNNLDYNINKMDKEVTELTDEIIQKIDERRIQIIDGKKKFLFMPQLERQCNWSYSLLSDEFVKKLGTYRDLLRFKYYMICQYIEDLLIRKLKIQTETIKLELVIRQHFHLPIYICIQCNLVKMVEIKNEVERLVKIMDSRILMKKDRQFQIWEDWWTGTNERKVCPLYNELCR